MRGVLVLLWGLTVGAALVQAGGGGSIETALSLAGCLSNSEPTACLKTRGLSILDDWLMSDKEDDDEEDSPADAKEAKAVEEHSDPDSLPPGLPAYLDDLVDRMSDSIVSMMGEGRAANTSLEEDRGHKKKKRKAIRRAIIKLIIVALIIKQKLKMLLIAFQTFLMFKFVALIGVYVLTAIVRTWAEIKHKHHPQKVIYYENAHHQHVYDSGHHDDHPGSWWSLWGRSIIGDSNEAPAKTAHQAAYSAYAPKSM